MTHRASERRKPSKYLHTNKNPPSGLSGRRVGFFFFCCLLPHSRQRQEQDEHGAANVQRRVVVYSSDGGGEGSRPPVRNRIPANVYEHLPPIKFPIVNSDGRKRTTGSFINAEPPQSLSGSVPCADRRAGGPDLMTLIAGGTGDRRVNAAALSSLQRSIISCV